MHIWLMQHLRSESDIYSKVRLKKLCFPKEEINHKCLNIHCIYPPRKYLCNLLYKDSFKCYFWNYPKNICFVIRWPIVYFFLVDLKMMPKTNYYWNI